MTYNAWNQRVGKENSSGLTKFIHDDYKLLLETDGADTTRSYTNGTGAGSGVGGAYGDLIEEYDSDSTASAYPAYEGPKGVGDLKVSDTINCKNRPSRPTKRDITVSDRLCYNPPDVRRT